jgi:hypothetical protein
MTELKLIGTLLKSLILWIILLIPRILVFVLGAIEAIFRILKLTIKTFTEELKKSVLKK